MAQDFIKDPDAVLDYHFDWNSWLPNGDQIISSQFIVAGGITVGNGSNGAPGPTNTTTNTTIWLLGGSPGQPYTVTNRIVTSQGRTDDRTITIRVQQR